MNRMLLIAYVYTYSDNYYADVTAISDEGFTILESDL